MHTLVYIVNNNRKLADANTNFRRVKQSDVNIFIYYVFSVLKNTNVWSFSSVSAFDVTN